MKQPTTKVRAVAITIGVIASASALLILCSDAIRTGHWEIEHLLLPAVVCITVAAGHLIGSAWRARNLMSMLGFFVLFCLGTIVTVYNSVGRQAATADTAVATAEAHNGTIADLRRDLRTAREDVKRLDWLVDWEMAGRPRRNGKRDMNGRATARAGCGTMCKGYKVRKQEAEKKVERLQQQLSTVGPAQIGAPKAERAAKIAALMGFQHAETRQALILLEPFLFALLFELAAIVAFGFGFAHRPAPPPPAAAPTAHTPPPRGGKPELVVSEDRLITELRDGGPAASQNELAKRLGVSKGEVSKTVAECIDRLHITEHTLNGRRCRAVALAG